MSTYLRCDGTVSNSIFDASAKKCSTGWLEVTEPSWALVTKEQADALFIQVTLLVVVIIVFKQLSRIF